MAKTIMAMIVVGSFIGAANARIGACPTGYDDISGLPDSCYKLHQESKSWTDAEDTCQSEGAVLASVTTTAQYNGILAYINANNAGTYWVSGKYEGGRWQWTSTHNGASMNDAWWGQSPRNNNGLCAYFCSVTLKYWDSNCSNSKRFICEYMLIGEVEAV